MKKLNICLYRFVEYCDWYDYPPRKFWKRLLNWFDKRNPLMSNDYSNIDKNNKLMICQNGMSHKLMQTCCLCGVYGLHKCNGKFPTATSSLEKEK